MMHLRQILKTFKKLCVYTIRKLPISSETLGPPKKCYTTSQYFKKCNTTDSTKVELQKKIKIIRKPPLTIDKIVYWKYKKLYKQTHNPIFTVTLNDGRVWSNCGAVITKNDILLRDISRESQFEKNNHSSQNRIYLGKLVKTPESIGLLATVWPDVYFHWMFDILPRINILKKANVLKKIDKLVIPTLTKTFQEESLKKLGINKKRIIFANNRWRFHIKAKKLVVPSLPSKLDTPMKWACEFLRDELAKGIQAKGAMQRTYISRSNSVGRRIINGQEVEAFLSTKKFQIVQCEKLTLREQILLFQRSSWIIAPHGAGLTNIVFCKAGTKILDIFSPAYINPVYWIIANEMNLKYAYLLGEGKCYPKSKNPENKSADILVCLKKLEKVIKKLE